MNNHFFEQKDCGLQAFWSSTPQFKTARVSAHLVLPLTTPENAALYALVPNIISRATREYPDYTQFGKRLAELYGASVQPGVTRVGDNQILTLAAAGIAATLRTAESWEGPLTDALRGEIGAAAENIRAIVAEAQKKVSLP